LNKEQQDKFNDRQNERLDLLKEWYKTYADILDEEVEKSEKTINEYDKQITKLKDW
jgi:ABC-type Fe3+-hydroxamate transport system substrate-binding protein